MVDHTIDDEAMSENIQMYLLKIAMLQTNDQPVPVPALAKALSVTAVSANEMCRKLTERTLIDYEPYKGVTLTEAGKISTRRIMRSRLLWEVFLVEKLGLSSTEADEMACRFEHVTPDDLTEHLAVFLGQPRFSPLNIPIPPSDSVPFDQSVYGLNQLFAGATAQIAGVNAAPAVKNFLREEGVRTGATVKLLALSYNGNVLLEVAGRQLSLTAEIAAQIRALVLPDANQP